MTRLNAIHKSGYQQQALSVNSLSSAPSSNGVHLTSSNVSPLQSVTATKPITANSPKLIPNILRVESNNDYTTSNRGYNTQNESVGSQVSLIVLILSLYIFRVSLNYFTI